MVAVLRFLLLRLSIFMLFKPFLKFRARPISFGLREDVHVDPPGTAGHRFPIVT